MSNQPYTPAELAALRAVGEAAKAWRGTYGWTPPKERKARSILLVIAVDAWLKEQEQTNG